MKKNLHCFLLIGLSLLSQLPLFAQNVFSGEPVQIVGTFNGFSTTPYGSDYRTTIYRRITTTTGNPNDGRGQWKTTINAQASGGDITPINMSGGNASGFLFISGPDGNRFNNKWNFNGIGQGALNEVNGVVRQSGGENMGLNMGTAGFYTFIFNDVGYSNSSFFVGYTAAAPITVTRNSQVLNPDGSAVIGITSSAAPSPNENIYVRYTLGSDFSGTGTSFIEQATGSGTSYSATIPSQTNGTSVRYFLFTSTQTLSQLSAASETNKHLSAMSVDDNTGANYLYASVLPVKITSFTGKQIENSNALNWTTETEINVKHYEVLRSTDGVNFRQIGIVNATSNTTSNTYEFIDGNPIVKNNYYRLKSVDVDGKQSLSKIIRISSIDKGKMVSVFPNPATDKIQTFIPKEIKGNYQIMIMNLSGQILSTYKYNNVNAGLVTIPLGKSITKGTYIIKIIDTMNTYNGTFLKL